MKINSAALSAKIEAFKASSEGKETIKNAVVKYLEGESTGGHGGSGGGSEAITYDKMEKAAKELIAMVRKHAASAGLPASVMAHIESLEASPIVTRDDGSAQISINMMDDPSRPSLLPENFSGLPNIVASFNRGIDAHGSVFGYWESAGKEVWSQRHRPALLFMQSAINEFNVKYGSKYNVTVTLAPEYASKGS